MKKKTEKTVKVQLTKEMGTYKEGEVLNVTEERANYWKSVGVATDPGAKAAPKVADAKPAKKAAVKTAAKKSVSPTKKKSK